MPAGLLALVAYGAANLPVSANPQMSYWYKGFLRHSHFSRETLRVALSGPQELLLDAPVQLRAKVPRSGDLLSDLTLVLRLPDVYSKVVPGRPSQHAFAWVRQVGLRVLQRVGFYVGGARVQEWSADYLAARAALDLDADAYAKWAWSIGDTPDLYAPEQGTYADPGGGYPHASDLRGGNAPSIPGRLLRVPLGLFFSEAAGAALPLVALQRHDVEVQVTLAPLRTLYTVLDRYGNRGRYGAALLPVADDAGPLPSGLNTVYADVEDASGAPRWFWTDYGAGTPPADGWATMDPHLEATVVHLTGAERAQVAARPARYCVRQVKELRVPGLGAVPRVRLDLDVHGLVTRLVWVARRSDALAWRNDPANLTNWKDAVSGRPFRRAPTATLGLPSSGAALPAGVAPRFIVQSARLLASGTEVFEERDGGFFADYQLARGGSGGAAALGLGGLLAATAFYPVYSYAFAVEPGRPLQPSGSLNTGGFTSVQLEVTLPTPPLPGAPTAFDYEVTVWAETLNFLDVTSGMGGMAWAT